VKTAPRKSNLDLHLEKSLSFTAEAARVSRTLLPSGVRILTEAVPGAPSVALAASVPVGSRDEDQEGFGSTHFLEHLLFKGTSRRSSRDISIAFDSVGGSSNAATAKEYTSYYARVQSSAVPLALDVILDMFTSARIDPQDFELERTVILEELAMNEDDPEDLAHEALAQALLPDHELGRPIGGTKQSILDVTREKVFSHYKQHYVPSGLIITAAGGVRHEEFVALVEKLLDDAGFSGLQPPKPRRSHPVPGAFDVNRFVNISHDFNQANILLGFESMSASDPDRYAFGLMNTILGGGMSSRLYQSIREDRGLAYSTYSYQQGYSETGYFGMYAGCNPENAATVVSLMRQELESLANDGASAAELELALGSLTGGLALRFESSLARMNRLLGVEIGTGEYLSISEVLERFRAVDLSAIQAAAQNLVANKSSLVVVGEGLEHLEQLA
jgi:predicted Zn-dependent peptidase